MNSVPNRPLAVVTGASSGIGLELARQCARHGHDLVIAADRPLQEAIRSTQQLGAHVEALLVDLSSVTGVEALCTAVNGRPVEILIANAGHGLGKGFLDQDFQEARHVVDTNIVGTLCLIHRIGNMMRAARRGRILITGSIAGFTPGTFQAVYNGTKAFIDSFSWALRSELQDTGVTVTCLMPGITDTEFFARADLMDTAIGASDSKMDPAEVARIGFEAMMDGDGDVIAGLRNRVQAAIANVTPAALLAEQHRRLAQPGSAHK
ncbi:MAG TPA: SDR family NAD(P)-dependent oxidoreductase [Steroidobacteraceae bacterium]|nr:SDR family NAD(P)-dependent oxidoreductase [Steroidobacteraceae bacterium]